MLINYLKIAMRNIKLDFSFSLINISGLAIGLACCIFILQYIAHEKSYDTYHQDVERIFRVNLKIETPSTSQNYAMNVPPAAQALKENFPQIEETARVFFWQSTRLVKYKDKVFYEEGFVFADPEIFNILSYNFLSGNAETSLGQPFSVVIPKRLADKYFPNENAMGKDLLIDNKRYKITGVVADAPDNTHLPFDIFVSMTDLNNPPWLSDWTWPGMWTYVKLFPNVNKESLSQQIKYLANPYLPEETNIDEKSYTYSLQPVTDIYLDDELEYDSISGNSQYLYIFTITGLIILLIACFNFMNLMTSRATLRAKEVGIRKAAGAERSELITQFLLESFLITFISFTIALLIVEISNPAIKEMTGIRYDVSVIMEPAIMWKLVILLICTGTIAGIYPAFVLSAFMPSIVLKGSLKGNSGTKGIRKILVFVQFAISGMLITGTLVVHSQISYMKKMDHGFNREHKIVIPMRGFAPLEHHYNAVKDKFLKLSSVSEASISSLVPGEGAGSLQTQLVDGNNRKQQLMYYTFYDPDVIPQYNMKMLAGRNFSSQIQSDIKRSCLINEASLKSFGWSKAEEAIGRKLKTGLNGMEKEIIGVIKNFNYRSAHFHVEPLVVEIEPSKFSRITLTVQSKDMENSLGEIKKAWTQLFPNQPFDYFHLDVFFNILYAKEEKMKDLFNMFSVLGLFIAGLGLWGLSTFIVNIRTKEVGIRKVLGSSVTGIVLSLSKDLTKTVFIANIISWPIVLWAMNMWLESFAYRIEISYWVFIIAGSISLFIAQLTIGSRAIKTARLNPVEALRYE